ncbi:hypothetical protein [Chitinophaga alhagiae]|uniref:hypothetical protein n=1 Tax=Chitinophaga alhagiae TaxID=2203219 RepID=UPI0018E4E436|nr:hypothetical protein [Chitinophaga alhagiae]
MPRSTTGFCPASSELVGIVSSLPQSMLFLRQYSLGHRLLIFITAILRITKTTKYGGIFFKKGKEK